MAFTLYLSPGSSARLLFLFILGLLQTVSLQALNPGAVSISMTTAPFYTVDSNDGCAKTPNAAYIGFSITNISGGTLTDLYVKLSDFTHGSFGLAGGRTACSISAPSPMGAAMLFTGTRSMIAIKITSPPAPI